MRVEGFDESGYIDELTLTKRTSEHSYCRFIVNVSPEKAALMVGKFDAPVKISIVDGKGSLRPVFCGKVQEILLERGVQRTRLIVTAVSATASDVDTEPHTRLWQNTQKTAGDIVQKLSLNGCQLKLDDTLKNVVYEMPFLQNQETEFALLCRLADYARLSLWVDDVQAGSPQIHIAPHLRDLGEPVDSEAIITLQMGRNAHGKIARLVTDRHYYFGSTLKLEQSETKYLVTGWQMQFKQGREQFDLDLTEYKPPSAITFNPVPLEKPVILRGKIKDNADPKNLGRVQVEIDKDSAEDVDSTKTWLNWRTPYAGEQGGVVFVPDKGDAVDVIFLNGEIYACAALRKRKLPDEAQNIKDKYIGNNYRQRIFWKEKSLELMSTDSKIFLDKDKIELIVGQAKICVDKENITLSNAQGELKLTPQGIVAKTVGDFTLNSGKSIAATAGDKFALATQGQFSADVGGKLALNSGGTMTAKAGGKAQIQATKVELG